MEIKYLKIFTDKLIIIEKEDGSRFTCIIETSKNDFDALEDLLPIQRDFSEITITIMSDEEPSGKVWVDEPIQLKNIFSIEIIE